jgi:TonB-dependent SusC/RagA subfamily outer membrane receptor
MRAFRLTRPSGRAARALSFAVLLASPALVTAQQATITGRVTAEGNGEALTDVRVFLVGTALSVGTGPDGRYTMRGVPAGPGEVRVIRVGFQETKKPVTVTAGQAVTLDFALKQIVVQLQEIVTTATGQQRRSEIGNTIATIADVSKRVEESPITDVTSLLTAKAPGVIVLPGTMTGTAGTIRIRGVSSLSLSNAPIWVVDGVRFNSSSFGAAGAGGSQVSGTNLSGLDPDEIEDIEIVKGPSAATLYGTDASNGVIVVTTKKGRAGATRWTWFGEGGRIEDHAHYPDTWAIWGHRPATPTTPVRCLLRELPAGGCVKDSVTSLNIIDVPNLTPISTGHRDQYGAQVSGGTESVRYFVSGDLQNEIGPIKLPQDEAARFDSLKTAIRDEWRYPEALQGQSMRANIVTSPSPTFDLSVSTGFTKLNQRFSETDNNFNSIFYQSMMSPGFIGAGLGNTGKDSRGQNLYGNNSFTYGDIFQRLAREDVQRLLGSAQASWRPLSWLQNDGTVGMDLSSRYSYGLCRFGECPDFVQWRLGQVSDAHRLNRNFSVKLTSNASWQARLWLNLKTTAGADYTNQEQEASTSNGTQLPPGAQSVSQAAVTTGGATLPSADKTLGAYLQEQATFRDRLFVIFALRTDQNSAFGSESRSITYPKASVSWIASDESFFPKYDWMNQFRVRAAYGASGVQPRSTDAFITYTTPTVNINNTDTPGLRASSLGNALLKPETTTEFEGGIDSRVLANRVNIELTYYSKKTTDALFNQNIAPSAAASATSVLKNLASVKNAGVEASITTTILDSRRLGWDLTLAGSHNTNKLLSLGVDGTGTRVLVNGTGANRDSLGFPVRGFYYRTYTYADSNSDGSIVPTEVVVSSTFKYVGPSIPGDIFSISNGFDLLDRQLRINIGLDYKGGYSISNGTYSFQCGNNPACPGLSNPNASLADQAAAVAFTAKNPTTAFGYLQNGQFWRFRELSATWNLSPRLLRPLRANSASLSFGARNLKVWTQYKGADPEENYGTGDVQSTFASSAPRRYYTLRLNLHY